MSRPAVPTAVFESFDRSGRGWHLTLDRPRAVHVARALPEVLPALAAAERAAEDGRWAAVALSYEAAPAFEPAVGPGRPDAECPLAWVAIFDAPAAHPSSGAAPAAGSAWTPLVDAPAYAAAIRCLHDRIAAGDTYQANYTFPLTSRFAGDPWAWYRTLAAAQGGGYSAYLDLGRHRILSCSPELFVARRGDAIAARPMKGTLPRGRWSGEDEEMARRLAASEKMRAENVMIVDLLRNDLGRIAVPGSVRVPALFTAERYETVWQLTSTVEATCRPGTGLREVMRAVFPCGSVTGAPKVRTMQILRALEPFPRGIYTGAVGFVRPGGDCTFNVAIRTVWLDTTTGRATFGVGGGITADSTAEGEYEECLVKAAFLTRRRPAFALLETLRLADGEYWLLERHLDRMRASAVYFGFRWDERAVRQALASAVPPRAAGRWRVRLTSAPDGAPAVEADPLPAEDARPLRVAFAPHPVDPRDPLLFHKTTARAIYEDARRAHPGLDDVILWNARGEVTESTVANVVIEADEGRWTPPRESGLLAGTFRDELLARGEIRERPIAKEELARAGSFFLINSVRGWMRAGLQGVRS